MRSNADQNVLDGLRAVSLFQAVPDKVLQRLAAAGRVVEHGPDHRIVAEGGAGVAMHLILEGQAEVDLHGKSRRMLGPGDYFGEIALIDGRGRSATVTSRTPLRVWVLAQWGFANLLDAHPELARALLVGLCARLRAAEASSTEEPVA